ncbi:ATP-dependent DNA helicase [Corynebacterium lubricantis]|uniref:ATP-dependent DNA helicase n=1 Tax=Corynebacterium lubricantis TaxID=541095 RepID=UPI00035C114B|nr:ATP-dependent DNA helicase [Corynebacterium lubricantis]
MTEERLDLPPNPTVYLVPRTAETQPRTWDLTLPEQGVWKVTGQAGAGVSSFLVDTVMNTIEQGKDPDGVLVVTASKESSARLRRELSERVAESGFVANEPLVRSVHSLAFALLRQRSSEQIRLISGAEQDSVIRQLLQGNAEYETGSWPQDLRPALTFVGFARQLRDFILRAVERQQTPETLRELGARHNMPIWEASGDFLAEYQSVMRLWGMHSYSASELVSEVLSGPITSRWHTIVVDDAQHLDPTSGKLLKLLINEAELAVVGGDLEQSVFHFRGASPAFFQELEATSIDLGATRRSPRRRVAEAPTNTAHTAFFTDYVRRAHLDEGVAWRDIAVVVRSSGMIEPIRRALLQAEVPVTLNPTDVVLGEQRIVAAMLLGIRALYSELTASEWRELLLGPVGGADPVTLRRLLRGLRRFAPGARAEETLQELLRPSTELPDFAGVLTDRELGILERIRSVLRAGHSALDNNASVEEILWEVWNATKLSDRLLAQALRGGAAGSQADRDLDAMMALFDAAGDFAERREHASIDAFVTHITEQELPTGVRDHRIATPDAVALLTAHGVVGREFKRVVVAGVQEGSWPSLGETGSLFGQEDLVDLLDRDIDPNLPVSHSADRLKEERRLFYVATTRATEEVVVTSVNAPDEDEAREPSRFIEEFCQRHELTVEVVDKAQTQTTADAPGEGYSTFRVLSKDELLAELRRAAADPAGSEATKNQAARQLARLAQEGVAGADPAQWYTTTVPSTDEPIDVPRSLSPSRIEGLLACPLQDVLGRALQTPNTVAMVRGSMAHAYFESLAKGVDEELARRDTVDAYKEIRNVPAWKEESDTEKFDQLLQRSNQWIIQSRKAYELVGTEINVDVTLSEDVRIRGRMDRLEREGSGDAVIVDLKTGKSAPSKDDTAANAQLFAYQLALSRGVLRDDGVDTAGPGEEPISVGGATLVYPATDSVGITTREQAKKSPEELEEFLTAITPLPAELTGPTLTAKTGPHCTYCPVRHVCPVQPEGGDVTHG